MVSTLYGYAVPSVSRVSAPLSVSSAVTGMSVLNTAAVAAAVSSVSASAAEVLPNPDPSKMFDPLEQASDLPSSQYHSRAPAEINSYIEKYFRTELSGDVFKTITMEDQRPDSDVMHVPELDESMTQWLGDRVPKTPDSHRSKIQRQILVASGPLTCLWDDVIHNQQDSVPAEVVVEMIQKTLVLLGHGNANVWQRRCAQVLDPTGDKALSKTARDLPLPETGRSLFGGEFFQRVGKEDGGADWAVQSGVFLEEALSAVQLG